MPVSNHDIWADALKEAESPDQRDAGLWAKSFAEADGDEAKARATYIKAKVEKANNPNNEEAPQPNPGMGWCPVCHDRLDLNARHCYSCKSSISARGLTILKHLPSGPSPLSQSSHASAQTTQRIQIVKTAKSRGIYILLGLFFLGMLGAHNFYAGRYLRGTLQLLCTTILGWFVIGLVITFVWVLIDLFTVTEDGEGVPLA